ncbi:MAG: hypothetical protein IJE27_05265, partial [Anaerotignum sp.]|nr:hypothetical protein [Anaerotignum sp.]
KVCANDANHVVTENCTPAATGALENGVKTYECTVCNGVAKSVVYLQTDKTTYFVGEPVLVTSEYIEAAAPWIGLWKADEDPNGAVGSIFWYYRGEDRVVDITKQNPQRESEFTAGDYKVVLMSTDAKPYVVEAEYYFSVVEAEESSRVVTEPTCTEQGYTTVYYTDGTSEKVDFVPALDHSWSKWEFDAETNTHSRVCGRDADHTATAVCVFDQGVVTKEPTATEEGVRTFTCTICEGIYTVKIPVTSVTEVSREKTTEPTCEAPGEWTITYSNGTTGTEMIPALGHAYGKFVMDENKTSHTKVCANDETHKITEDCTPDSGVLTDGAMVYSCTVCEGVMSETLIIKTDKTEYKYGEPIMVSTQFASDYAPWIGLYKKGDIYGDVEGAVKSIFWAYISEMPVVNGVPTVDIRTTRDENSRSSEFVAGEYRVYVFDQDSYFEMGYYDFTVTKELTSTETKAADCENDGYVKEYYSDGTSEIVSTTPKLNHAWSTWAYDAATKTHARTCGNDAAHKETGNCEFDNGVVTTEPTETADGVKTFTCGTCGGTYTEAVPATGKVVDRTETITAPGCETTGTLRTYYTDGTYIDTVIPVTGHAYGNTWSYNNDRATHSRVCGNDATHIETANCEFTGVEDGDGVLYTCGICGGSYSTAILTSDKDVYSLDDPVYVTAFCENDYSWVGLYEEDDAYDPNNGGEVSEQWYYVVDSAAGVNNSGKPVNIMDPAYRQTDLSANGVTNGRYKLVLFGDGNYGQVLATKYITFDTNMDNTTFTVKVNGETAANGSSVNLKLEDSAVINVTA